MNDPQIITLLTLVLILQALASSAMAGFLFIVATHAIRLHLNIKFRRNEPQPDKPILPEQAIHGRPVFPCNSLTTEASNRPMADVTAAYKSKESAPQRQQEDGRTCYHCHSKITSSPCRAQVAGTEKQPVTILFYQCSTCYKESGYPA